MSASFLERMRRNQATRNFRSESTIRLYCLQIRQFGKLETMLYLEGWLI
jgi:hypothetical protein